MYSLAVNRFAVVVDGTVMDKHRAAWLAAGAPLPLGSRLVYTDPDDRTERLGSGTGNAWARVVCTALKPPGSAGVWLVVLEGRGLVATVPLPSVSGVLGIAEATGALERELFFEPLPGGRRLHPIPASDPELPGGVPSWYSVDDTSYVWKGPRTDPCRCLSGLPFEDCHGGTAAETHVNMSSTTPIGR